MSFIKQTLLTIALCFILQYFLPWWTLALGAAAVGYWFGNNGWVSFFAGLTGVALLWFAYALMIDVQTQSILSEKVAKLFPTKSKELLFLITALVGGLPAGFAALTGALLRDAREEQEVRSNK